MERNSSLFEENYALFMERFPQLALMIPEKGKEVVKRETVQPICLNGVEVLYFYGIGCGEGYAAVIDWLKGDKRRRLVFLEDDLGKWLSFLKKGQAKPILEDPQVVLGRLEELHTFAERFPVKKIAVTSLPSKNRFKKWKETLLRKTAFAHSIQIDRLHGHQLFQNFVQNLQQLPRSFYANKLAGKFEGIPAIVCGAGPSLKQAFHHLRTLENKALLIAGGSTLAALSSQGILPHFGMAVDPNLEEYRRLKNSFAFEVPLLYSTRVFPQIFQTANGPFGYMRSGIGGVPEVWMEEELGLLDPLIGEHLSSDAISVTSTCLAWAQFLGCNPILFCGTDLAYTGGQRYAPGVSNEEVDFEEAESAADQILIRKDRKGKPIHTAVRWLMESAAFSHFAKMHPKTTFLNTTDGGIEFKKIPFCPLEEATRPFSELRFSLRKKVHDEIAAVPMPSHSQEVIEKKMKELRESLERVIWHLEICSGKRAGSRALAELELVEESAYLCLFYDAMSILEKELEDSSTKWSRFLKLAQNYSSVL